MAIISLITIDELQAIRAKWRAEGLKVGFVPTMGALHEGHLSLVKKAKELCDRVVVSIFVNPTQFGPNEDYARYPRTLKEDVALIEGLGVDAVFMPNASDIYPEGFQTYVTNEGFSNILCGRSRPGHFKGVLTIVLKLFNLVDPAVAVFGKKDYQQWRLIERMARDLALSVEVVGSDIVREADGLAKSSRNRYLSEAERPMAAEIYAGLNATNQLYKSGERQPGQLIQAFQETLANRPEVMPEYIEVRYQDDLSLPDDSLTKPAVILVACRLGNVRLIDNLELG